MDLVWWRYQAYWCCWFSNWLYMLNPLYTHDHDHRKSMITKKSFQGGHDNNPLDHKIKKPWLVTFWWSKLRFFLKCILHKKMCGTFVRPWAWKTMTTFGCVLRALNISIVVNHHHNLKGSYNETGSSVRRSRAKSLKTYIP